MNFEIRYSTQQLQYTPHHKNPAIIWYIYVCTDTHSHPAGNMHTPKQKGPCPASQQCRPNTDKNHLRLWMHLCAHSHARPIRAALSTPGWQPNTAVSRTAPLLSCFTPQHHHGCRSNSHPATCCTTGGMTPCSTPSPAMGTTQTP